MGKLLVMMVDGVSADHYAARRNRLPHMASLEARGFRVERLHSEVLGTSLPGRTSLLTGVTADVSGVYANKIWGGETFRYSTPDDVCVPTIPARAKAAGRDVAVLGMGMIRPEDAHTFIAPWWAGEFIQRGRDATPVPAEAPWVRAAEHPRDARFLDAVRAAGLPEHWPNTSIPERAVRAMFGLTADLLAMEWAAALAVHSAAPDLILLEFLTPDSVQHSTGYDSALSQWSVQQADAALGVFLAHLTAAGVQDQWNIAVLSDHGHSAVQQAIYTSALLPDVPHQCEGGSLLVAAHDQAQLDDVAQRLAAFGAERYPNSCLPRALRDTLAVFVAAPGWSFEDGPADFSAPTGTPENISTHGLKPGLPGDDRFALFAGPDVMPGRAASAAAVSIAPTFARVLGLPTDDFPAQPLF